MKHLKQLLVLTFLIAAVSVNAQKMKVEKGDFKFLKGQKEINIVFKYDKMKMYKDKRSEEKYIKERTKELNEKTKGKGDTWAKKWASSRELIWEPKFLELLNRAKNHNFSVDNADAKYTLIVETTWLYPGYNVGVMKQGAKVTTVLKFVETANMDKVKLKINSKNAPGDTYMGSYSNEDRIGEGYAKTGKSLMKMLNKKVK